MSLASGSSLGPYTITAELGHGGMGVVYTAQDPRLDRQVAIKVLPPDLTRDETAKQRFLQEAKAASALDHPNICTIFEINETADGQLYLVMAYYEGETLKQRIERGALAVNDAIDIATQVGRGLAEAHGAGIVHRDIKPANLLVATSGVVKILDFGLAKLIGTEDVTQSGAALGTVAYMSPEQARGQEVDRRTDIWSLGVVLYEMLAGKPPFQGENLGLEGLHVSARTSSFKFKGQALGATEIGTQLKVNAILEGSVRKAGNRLRIAAQLINVGDGFHLWSERYDRDMDDVFAVQDEIAHSVVEKLKVKLLGAADTPLVKRPTDNLEAYNLYLQGRYYRMRLTGAPLEKGLECFTRALAIEPSYAQAHAGVAYVQAVRSALSLVGPPHTVMPEAKGSALKALALDETVVDAHTALAFALHYYEWDWAGAERAYRRALELDADDAFARSHYAVLLGQQGRADESVAHARAAVEGDPVSLLSRFILVVILVLARRFDVAVTEAQASIVLDPTYAYSYGSLAMGLAGLGRYDEAVDAERRATILAPGEPTPQGALGLWLGLAGHRQESLAILDDFERRQSQERIGGWWLGVVSLGVGDHDQAISWLRQAAEEREGIMTYLNTFFYFDPLRADPRFQALLKKMNFPATDKSPEA